MSARRVLLAVIMAFPGAPAFAQSPTKEPYNAVAMPLDDLSKDLLNETGYEIRADGNIWDKLTDSPVRKDEMQYLLARLAGARRLKALLELNLILNRSEGEKKLNAEEKEAVRKIVRQHWPVFGVGTRRDFRAYFSVEELTHLDKIPPRFDRGSAMMMRDPGPVTEAAAAPPPPPPVPSTTLPPEAYVRTVFPIAPSAGVAPPPDSAPSARAPEPEPAAPETVETETAAPAPRPFPRGVLTPFMEPPSLRRPSPFAPRRRLIPTAAATVEAAPERPAAPAPARVAPSAPAPAPIPPGTAPAVASLLAALAPLPAPAPMIYSTPDSPSPAPAPAPAPAAPAPLRSNAPAPAEAPASATVALPAPPPPLYPVAPLPVTARPPAPSPRAGAPVVPVAPAAAPPPLENPALGVLKPWVPPGTEAPAAAAAAPAPPPVAAPVVPPVAAPKLPERPVPADASQSEFEAFIAAGPYGRDAQVLLKLIAEKAPDFCRALLRRTLVRGTPLIVHDGSRAGFDRRAGFVPAPAGTPAIIALSAGPVFVERRQGVFGKSLIVVPEDPKAWAELGVAPPALEALKKDAVPTGQDSGPWGTVKQYRDKSRRGTYSTQQQAGELLERLLILGLDREGYYSSTYAARAWARSARLLFSARLLEDHGNDAFLDPDRRVELRDWIERGDEADDLLIASWSSARGNVIDPRRGGPESQALYERAGRESCSRSLLADHLAEASRGFAARARTLEALAETGLISSADARASAEKAAAAEAAARKSLLESPPKCERGFGADETGLKRSAALLAEASRAERVFRERKAKGGNNAARD